MRPHPRIRRVAKWTGLGACVLILAAWGVSLRYGASTSIGNRGFLSVCNGSPAFIGTWMGSVSVGVWDYFRVTWPKTVVLRHPWCGIQLDRPWVMPMGNGFEIDVPFWLLLLAATIPTALLFHRDRHRIPPGHCRQCGYNLFGNVSGVCPECGGKVPAEQRPTADE